MKIKIKGLNIETKVEDFYTKEITKFGNGAKIDCSKKYIRKKVIVLILKNNTKNIKTTSKNVNIAIKAEDFYTKTVTKFGNGAKIDCSKKLMGKKVIVLILK